MAIVRCKNHPIGEGNPKTIYVNRVKPFGYPDTAICSAKGCTEPGFVWLSENEVEQFNDGERCFTTHFDMAKIRVIGRLMELPKKYFVYLEQLEKGLPS
jgi:hypothetical protein